MNVDSATNRVSIPHSAVRHVVENGEDPHLLLTRFVSGDGQTLSV